MHPSLEITRLLDTTLATAFSAFSTKEAMAEWWGPKGFEIEIRRFEFQPSGIFHYVLLGPERYGMWGKFTFLEIEAPNRIAFLNCFSNAAGETVKAPEIPFGPDWPLEMWTEYRFTEQGDQTLLKLTSHPHHASEASNQLFLDNHSNIELGFKGTFAKLDEYLERLK